MPRQDHGHGKTTATVVARVMALAKGPSDVLGSLKRDLKYEYHCSEAHSKGRVVLYDPAPYQRPECRNVVHGQGHDVDVAVVVAVPGAVNFGCRCSLFVL